MPWHKFQVIYLNSVVLYLLFVVQAHAFNEYKLAGISAMATHGKNEARSDRFKTGNGKRNSSDFSLKSLSKFSVYSGMNRSSYYYLKSAMSPVASVLDSRELQKQTTKIISKSYKNKPLSKSLRISSDFKKSINIYNSSVSEKTTKSLNRSVRHLRTLTMIDCNSSNDNISFANLEVKHQQLVLSKPSFDTNTSNNSTKFLTISAPKKEFNNERELETDSSREQATTQDIWTLSSTNNDSVGDGNSTECTNISACNHFLGHAPTFHTHTLVKGIVLLNLGILACVGNVATLTSIIRRGRQHSSTVYLLLVHLSVSDLFVTCFCIIGEGFWTLTVEWYGGDFLCRIFKFLQMFSLYLSTFILVVIGFDRLCAVKFPMRRIKARMQVHRAVTSAWVLSGVLSAPQVRTFLLVVPLFSS
ncbi:Gonadotropin-releasing hormone receptor [Araneus ventricosus]|uniref:Gonadotropin-releasing hormone receptor n=1 Tax=Araneus ventricosus TaxID=182803 RepID=A0A4Y2F0K1_ARAVE|nr:Gonadotropin-releasing hormone receptor [Araneus ventricosus]